MEDRKATLLAAAFGGAALGGLWWVRPVHRVASLRVLDQWAVPKGSTEFGRDAAFVFRVARNGLVAEAFDEGRSVAYVLMDSRGHILPLDLVSPGVLKLRWGFPRGLSSPRLVALADGKALAQAPVADVPDPRPVGLPAAHPGQVALVYEGGSGVAVLPRVAVPRDERWMVVARRTRFAPVIEDTFALVNSNWGPRSNRLSIPFPSSAGAVEVEILRYRMARRTETVRISGMRLVRRFGGTALVVDRPFSVPNPLGAPLVLPQQDNGPRRSGQARDSRIAFGLLSLGSDSRNLPPEHGFRREGLVRLEILSPSPEELGLTELRLGPGGRFAAKPPLGPVREGPFSVTARVTLGRLVPIGRTVAVLPVENGPPSVQGPPPMAFDPWSRGSFPPLR